MLNNFIYAKLKSLFEEKLAANEVPQEAIVFIEDTKEIWNHGTYFDGSTFDSSNIEASIKKDLATVATSGSYNDLIDRPEIPNPITESTIADWGFTKGNLTSVDIDEEVVESPEMEYATKGYVDNALAERTAPETKLTVHLKDSNGTMYYDIKAKVSYGAKKVELSSGTNTMIPVGEDVIIEFPKLEGFKRPDTMKFVMPETDKDATAIYSGATVTLNVSTYDGQSTDGQVVIVQKTVTIDCTPDYDRIDELGVAIMDIYGKFYRDADEWIAAGRPVPNGVAVSDGTHRFCIAMQNIEDYDALKNTTILADAGEGFSSTETSGSQLWGTPLLVDNGADSFALTPEEVSHYRNIFDRNAGVLDALMKELPADQQDGVNSLIRLYRNIMPIYLVFITSGYDIPFQCFMYSFPNKNTGYLGSSGEWCLASTFSKKIDSLFSSIGGKALGFDNLPIYWTNTLFSEAEGWVLLCIASDGQLANDAGEIINIPSGQLFAGNSMTQGYIRPFCTLDPKHQTITTAERLVVKNGKVTFNTPYEAVNTVVFSDKNGYITPERMEFQASGSSDSKDVMYGEHTSMTIDYH